eukprot:2565322-Rhodomonas_salina.3
MEGKIWSPMPSRVKRCSDWVTESFDDGCESWLDGRCWIDSETQGVEVRLLMTVASLSMLWRV